MGYTRYMSDSRSVRSSSMGYTTKSVDEIFTQSAEQKAHESMNSKGIVLRECRDSEAHPNTVPIILALDVTGSMGHIPHELIKDGLPKLMSDLIQKGCPDASLLFLAVGDHECDRYPMQAGQFESGDEELDMWLTRTFLEGRGGGNMGESYLLAWEFAATRTATDAFDKRGKKGVLITIGDEPCLPNLPKSALTGIYGAGNENAQSNQTKEELLEKAQEKWDVYHINLRDSVESGWRHLGQGLVNLKRDPSLVPNKISELVLASMERQGAIQKPSVSEAKAEPKEEIEIL